MTGTSLPTGSTLPKDVVRRDFSWFGDTGESWSKTRFLVPNGWQNLSQPTEAANAQDLVTIAAFVSPTGDASLRLQAIRLEREISAELWLRHYLIIMGNRPIILLPVSQVFADSLSEFKIDEDRVSSRIAARIHGQLLFLISATCQANKYAGYAEAFGVSVASFRPDSPANAQTIETHKTARIEGLLGFEYPESWTRREVPAVPGKYATDLLSINFGQPTGMIRVKIAVKGSGIDEPSQLSDALEEFTWAGIRCNNMIVNTAPSLVNERFLSGQLRIYDASTQAGSPQELWIMTLEDVTHYVTLTLLTPSRQADFLIWAFNKTAMNLVSESLN